VRAEGVPQLQAKLARTPGERTIRRLGESKATHRAVLNGIAEQYGIDNPAAAY
jgi:hypothetical protein